MSVRGQRIEAVVQALILLAVGGCAAAASFRHVHDVAASHGQAGWLAWADAVVLELMSITTGLEIRRRHRAGQPAGFVLAVLIGAVALSLSAQVVEAERSVVGWLAAALPAMGFLACVKIVLARTSARPLAAPASVAGPVLRSADLDDQDDSPGMSPPSPDLLANARVAMQRYRAASGREITRDQLRAELRISTDMATALLRRVRAEDGRGAVVPVAADAFARVNGRVIEGGDL